MFRLVVTLSLIAAVNSCCGIGFTTCCWQYAPPQVVGHYRIPIYAKVRVPVQREPTGYVQAPVAPSQPIAVSPAAPTQQEIIVEQQPIQVEVADETSANVAAPANVIEEPTQLIAQPRPTIVVQQSRPAAVMVQGPSYALPPQAPTPSILPSPTVFVQQAPPPAFLKPTDIVVASGPVMQTYSQPQVISGQVGEVQIEVPSKKSIKLRRAYLKQVKLH